MKKLIIMLLLVLTILTCTTTRNNNELSIYDVIEKSSKKIAEEIPKGSRVAIVAFESENDNLSDYIMEELTGALFDRGIEVADRQNLSFVYKELNFQMSGDVSDESAKSIGKFLAADMVITGNLTKLDNVYRYRTSTINVETAMRSSITRFDVQNDTILQRIVNSTEKIVKYGTNYEKTPQTSGTFIDRGIMFADKGEYDKAINDFNEAIKLNPDLSTAYYLRGMVLLLTISEISNSDINSITVSDDKHTSFNQLIMIDQIIQDLNQAIRLDPYFDGAYHHRGCAYLFSGNYKQAILDFTYAIKLNANIVEAYNNRGVAYINMNDHNAAILDLSRSISINSNYSNAYKNRGVAYGNRFMEYGNNVDFDSAIADFNKFMQLEKNPLDKTLFEVYSSRGLLYHKKKKYDNAIADYKSALNIYPDDDDLKFMLAVALKQRGGY